MVMKPPNSTSNSNSQKWCSFFLLILMADFACVKSSLFEPFNVTYDHRSLIIAGRRRILISAGLHYPRATPQMWPDLIAKAKEGGADVIETYTFWNGHEPVRGEYNFEGRYDLVKFVKLVGSSGLYLFLRIGPYVCAEWNFGGFPVWLRDIPGIEFRTDNEPFKEEMELYVTKIVNLMLEEKLFSWQGGPIILLQIENEYGDVEHSYGQKGRDYINWAANMAVGLGAGVPWVMCKQSDAPEFIINTCNGYYCDGFKPNSNKKPSFWTEDWDGWYTKWGGRLPHRPAEDLSFAVARFFQRGGSLQNYYMYFGGTNFGRTSGGPFYITSYDYDAPIDEYGLLSQPKWGHLKDLHAAIKLCEPALVAVDSPHYIKLGPMQEAHVYRKSGYGKSSASSESGDDSRCSAFLANIDQHKVASVHFQGHVYTLPPWSVSILPDCQNVAYNTAKVGAQTSIKELESYASHLSNSSISQKLLHQDGASYVSSSWVTVDEPVGVWIDHNFTVQGILEHLNVTKDLSDYLWYLTRIYVSSEDVSFWKKNGTHPAVTIDSMRDVVHIFVNGQLAGSGVGHWVNVEQPVTLLEGYNDVALLCLTVGLQNYGSFLEKDGGGFKGQIKLSGLSNGDMDLSSLSWTYQVGLKGEMQEIYTLEGNEKAAWVDLKTDSINSPLSWYKTYFDAPDGLDPVALDPRSMGKGQAWVNGHHIGRYWNLTSPQDGCERSCDYRGKYESSKCTTNCGKPTQVRYHVPRSWLQQSNNLLVVFEEMGGNPFEISLTSHYSQIICGHISESHNPPLSRWLPGFVDGQIMINDTTPEMHLHCEDGHVISLVFASYGTPKGSCQKYSKGSCHAPSSSDVVTALCNGKQTCSIRVSNAEFGGDPCRGVVKTLAVEAKCISSQVTGSSSI